MSLPTTTVGSFPKPGDLKRARWAFVEEEIDASELRKAEDQAVGEWIKLQERLGLELLTDGEMRRGDMVGFLVGRLDGLEDAGLVRCFGNRYYHRPRVSGPIVRRDSLTVEDWKAAQALTAKTVKAVLPGPYTLMDWSFDEHYDSREACCLAFAEAIRAEAEELVNAGASEIQLDEPAISARPEEMELAAAALERVTTGLRGKTRVWAHLAYGDHAPVIDRIFALPVDGLMLEMANSDYLLLDALQGRPEDKLLAAGVVDAVQSRVEPAEEIRTRIERLLEKVPADRLWIAPDAGLRSLTTEQARAKLEAMAEAAAG